MRGHIGIQGRSCPQRSHATAAARARSFSAEPPFRSRVVVANVGAKFHSSRKTASFLGNVAEKPALRTREASDHVANSAGLGGIAGICHFLSRGCASQPHNVYRQGFHVLRALSRQPCVFRAQALPFARTPARSEIAKRRRIGGKHRPSARAEPNWSKAVRRSGAGQIADGTDLRPVGERKRFRGACGAAARREQNGALAHTNSDRARGRRNPVPVPGESRRAMNGIVPPPDRRPGRLAGVRFRPQR